MQPPEETANASDRPPVASGQSPRTRPRALRFAARFIKWLLGVLGVYFTVCTLLLILYNWTYPPTTGVQIQRRVESLFREAEYRKHYVPLSEARLPPHIVHAVIAAEDTRFYSHAGFDWKAIERAYVEGGRRGGSTISQQLAKNLFLTTHRSYLRKGLEVPLTFLTEIFLPKDRILALYVNVVEWGDGLYGVESAAQAYFAKGAERLTRSEAAALAACLPNPRVRRPRTGGRYTHVILRRMHNMGF